MSTGRRWYLVAFDVDRRDWRTLRVDRIGEVEPTGHRFRLDEPARRRRRWSAGPRVCRRTGTWPGWWSHTSPEHLATRVPPTVGVVEAHPDGALLTVGADDLAFLAGHLVALDLPFEALDPPELLDLLRRAGQRLGAAHG